MSLVSAVVPVYNGEVYIEQAIASILEQTYDRYEIILVNDGSTDSTERVIAEYISNLSSENRERITYISQENQGVAVARNRGLKVARGEYIAFLDQDDFFYPDKLELQISSIESQPNIAFVSSGWNIVDKSGKILSSIQPWQSLPQLNPADILIWKPVFLGAMLFRHSWLQKTNGFNAQLQQTPDVELVLRLAAMGCRGDWVKKATMGYRQHQSNASNNTVVQAQELNQMLEDFFVSFELNSEIRAVKAQSCYQSLVWSAWRLYQSGNLTQMCDYLALSCRYSDRYKTATILHWIESFKKYAGEYGTPLNVDILCNSTQWQDLVKRYLQY